MSIKIWLKRAGIALAGLAVVVIVGFLGWRQVQISNTVEQRPQIDPKMGVDELFAHNIGGISQWFHVRGLNRDNPVLLYLHGGPGTAMIPFSYLYQSEWEKDFIVVNWDQRGAGKTGLANDPKIIDPEITWDRMLADALEVTQFLKNRYGKQKIAILGHSWGSELGHGLVMAYPEHFTVYVGVGVVVNLVDNERVGYQKTLEMARQKNDVSAIAALESIAPYPEANGSVPDGKTSILRPIQFEYGIGISHQEIDVQDMMVNTALASPETSLLDIWALMDESETPQGLVPDTLKFDARRLGTTFEMPVIYALGRHDWQTPSTLAAAFLDEVHAPYKKVVWFENSAHAPNVDEPEEFAKMMRSLVRPLAD